MSVFRLVRIASVLPKNGLWHFLNTSQISFKQKREARRPYKKKKNNREIEFGKQDITLSKENQFGQPLGLSRGPLVLSNPSLIFRLKMF